MRTKLMGLAIAGAVFGLSIGAAHAGLYIIPNNGIVDQAEAEPLTNWPNPPYSGFPLGLNGRQHNAALVAAHAGDYRFTFLGSGNSTRFNIFTVLGNTFGSQPPGSPPGNPSFVVTLAANTPIPFTYTTAASSTAQPSCSISNGGNSTGSGEDCHYLVALANGTDGSLASPDTVAFIGFSDLPGGTDDQQIACVGDCDFQDLTVRVEQVPVPATLALFGAGLLGLGLARRRQSA